MLTSEQTTTIKNQLIKHIESSFPEDKKQFAINQIESMDSAQVEEFLKKNKLITTSSEQGNKEIHEASTCVFCSIVSGDINSSKIGENNKAVAVLEINPVSHGHVLIIPKEHLSSSDKLPQIIFSLAKSVSKIIKRKLKPKKVTIASSNLFGHEVLNVIPVYDDENLSSERKQSNPEELSQLQSLLTKKNPVRKPKRIKLKTKSKRSKKDFIEIPWLPKRIP